MMKLNNVEFLVGSKNFSNKSLEPFNKNICNFLSDLSSDLKLDPLYKKYPDIVTLSFWLRKQNIGYSHLLLLLMLLYLLVDLSGCQIQD